MCIIYFQRASRCPCESCRCIINVDVSKIWESGERRHGNWVRVITFYWTFLPLCFSHYAPKIRPAEATTIHACTFDMNECAAAGDFVYRPLSFQLSVGSKSALRNNLVGIFISHTHTEEFLCQCAELRRFAQGIFKLGELFMPEREKTWRQ